MPPGDGKLQLSAHTLAWLATRPHARTLVHSVWNTLTDLERSGQHPGAIAALRSVLIRHQPAIRAGRCRTCRRVSWRHLWRRRPFPCTVWMNAHVELHGLFSGSASGAVSSSSRQPLA